MNIYTLEFYAEEDELIDDIMDYIMLNHPQLEFDVYKEDISEQLQ